MLVSPLAETVSLRPLGAADVHPSKVTKPKRDIARPLSRSTLYHLSPLILFSEIKKSKKSKIKKIKEAP